MQPFESRPPVDIIRDVFLLKKRKDKGETVELPLLTIVLHNKQAFSGFVMDFKQQNNGAYHLSVELEGSNSLFFAEAFSIQGVVIHDFKRIDHLLTEISSENAGDRAATRLEIRNKMAQEAGRLSTWFGKPIEMKLEQEQPEPKDLFFIGNIVTDIAMTLLSIGEAEPGKGAIIDAIDKIVLRKGTDRKIEVKDKTLEFTDTFSRSYSTNLQRANLYEAIVGVI